MKNMETYLSYYALLEMKKINFFLTEDENAFYTLMQKEVLGKKEINQNIYLLLDNLINK